MHISWTSRRKPRLAVLASAGLAISFLTVLSPAQASTNPFDIDGVVPGEDEDVVLADPYGNSQELGPINGSSTKLGVIHTATPPMLGTTNPNAQVDLRNIWLGTEKSGGDSWLYFAWERDSSNGSGVIMYEFMQAPVPAECDNYAASPADLIAACNPWKLRQPGDFILVWDQQGTTIQIIKRVWEDTDGTSGAPYQLELTTGDSLGSAVATSSPNRFFGEAAINLTQDVFPPTMSECTTYANVIPGTVTGNSDTADYKDTVLQDISGQVNISNCGQVRVVKDTEPDEGLTGSFDYAISRSDDTAIRYAADGYSGDELTSATGTLVDDGGADTVVDLIAGTNYTLTEDLGAEPYELTSIVCTTGVDTADMDDDETFTVFSSDPEVETTDFPVISGETTECIITNTLQKGTLVVEKIVVNDNGGDMTAGAFSFVVDDGDPVAFTEDAVDDQFGSNSIEVNQGTYSVVEDGLPIDGYATTYANDANENEDCADLYVAAGATVTCTITNDDIQPRLTLVKEVVNDNGGTLGVSDFPLFVDATEVVSGDENGFDAGSYTASETTQAGYTASDWGGDCAADGSITLALGDDKTCTITNDDRKAGPEGTTVQSWVLKDSLAISGLRAGAPDAGTAKVTFRLYDDAACTVESLVGSEEDTSIVSGAAATSAGITVEDSGTYYWTAQYSGDQFNNGFTTDCGDEITEIKAQDAKDGGRDDFASLPE